MRTEIRKHKKTAFVFNEITDLTSKNQLLSRKTDNNRRSSLSLKMVTSESNILQTNSELIDKSNLSLIKKPKQHKFLTIIKMKKDREAINSILEEDIKNYNLNNKELENRRLNIINKNQILNNIIKTTDNNQQSAVSAQETSNENDQLDKEILKEKMISITQKSIVSYSIKAAQRNADERTVKPFFNVFDSLSEDEFSYVDEGKWFNFHPDNMFRKTWSFMFLLALLFSAVYYPLLFAFVEYNDLMLSFETELMVDIIFLVEFLLSFLTGIYMKGKVVYTFQTILRNYKSIITIDLICIFPYALLSELTKINSVANKAIIFLKLFRFYRFFRWLNFSTLKFSSNKKEASHLSHEYEMLRAATKKVVSLFLLFFMVNHFCACCWIYIGRYYDQEQNWIVVSKLSSNGDIYSAAFYFSLVTIFGIGYGDIVPTNINERLYLIFFLMFGCGIYAYFISILSILVQHFEVKSDLSKTLMLIESLTKEYNLTFKFKNKLINSLNNNEVILKRNQFDLVNSLPKSIKSELIVEMFKKKTMEMKFFTIKSSNIDFIKFTLPLLKYQIFNQKEALISFGQIVDHVLLISHGKLNIELDFIHDFYNFAKLHSGYHYGDIIMYSNSVSKINIRVTSQKAETFKLGKENMNQIKLNFPSQYNEIFSISYQISKEMEERRIAAVEYYSKYGTFDNFKHKVNAIKIRRLMNELKEEENPNVNKKDYQENLRLSSTSKLKKQTLPKKLKDGKIRLKDLLSKNLKEIKNRLLVKTEYEEKELTSNLRYTASHFNKALNSTKNQILVSNLRVSKTYKEDICKLNWRGPEISFASINKRNTNSKSRKRLTLLNVIPENTPRLTRQSINTGLNTTKSIVSRGALISTKALKLLRNFSVDKQFLKRINSQTEEDFSCEDNHCESPPEHPASPFRKQTMQLVKISKNAELRKKIPFILYNKLTQNKKTIDNTSGELQLTSNKNSRGWIINSELANLSNSFSRNETGSYHIDQNILNYRTENDFILSNLVQNMIESNKVKDNTEEIVDTPHKSYNRRKTNRSKITQLIQKSSHSQSKF